MKFEKVRAFARAVSTPAWRWGTFFLFWGIFHISFSNLVLSTSHETLHRDLSIISLINYLIILLVLITHITGLKFKQWRWLRLLLWLLSFLCLCIVLGIPLTDSISNLFDYSGRTWLALAFLAQFTADAIHSFNEWRIASQYDRPLLRIRTIIGFHFMLLPLLSLASNHLRYQLWRENDYFFFTIEKINPTYSPEEDETIVSDYKRFHTIEEEFRSAWKDGKHADVFSKWQTLKDETKDKPYLEKSRFHILIMLLRDSIPDDKTLCAKIQSELREAESQFPLMLGSSTFKSLLAIHYSMEKIGICPESELCYLPRIICHNFKHLTEPLSQTPLGLERCYRAFLITRINEFYRLKLKAIYTPLEEFPKLEDEFDKWLASVPWSYYCFMPNQKCMDGVGVHINRYADLYELFDNLATHRTADVAIAIHQYRLKHGKWPDSLELLVPEFIPALPKDPFTNGPLHFATHPEIKDALTIFAQRKLGDDHFPNERERSGFPVR